MIRTEANVPAEKLAGYFLERDLIEGEKDALAERSKILFAAMKGEGHDTKAARVCFREKRIDREASPDDVAKAEENEAILDLYRVALTSGLTSRARPATAREKTLKNSASSELTETQEQPDDPASQSTEQPTAAARVTTPDANTHGQTGTADTSGLAASVPASRKAVAKREGQSEQEAAAEPPVDTNSNSVAPPLPGETDKTGEADRSSPASSVTDFEPPAFLRKEDKPDCLKLRDGHCKIGFATSALCSDCNAARMKARAA